MHQAARESRSSSRTGGMARVDLVPTFSSTAADKCERSQITEKARQLQRRRALSWRRSLGLHPCIRRRTVSRVSRLRGTNAVLPRTRCTICARALPRFLKDPSNTSTRHGGQESDVRPRIPRASGPWSPARRKRDSSIRAGRSGVSRAASLLWAERPTGIFPLRAHTREGRAGISRHGTGRPLVLPETTTPSRP